MKNYKSGKFVNQGGYKSFQPTLLNRKWEIDDMQVISLLSKADRFLGRLDMYSEYVDIDLFIQMHIAKEATQSSKIEGTQTKVEEAFLAKSEISAEKRDDWEEVQNYIMAMNEAVEMLHRLPFSTRLIKQAHKVLLQGVRGQHKQPGEFRNSQNWIGGATLNDAIFIPPVHYEIDNLMSDIEKFANSENDFTPDLIKIALIHYQFETIHPFLDGNGRTGRLLITLYLVSKNILKRPILYLSDFFERHRTLYYDNLMRVRTHNDISQWLKFFLTGVVETSQNGVNTLSAIMQLKNSIEKSVDTLGKRGIDARLIIDYMYKKPIISASEIMKIIDKSPQTIYNLLADLEKLDIIKEITGAQRNKLYVFGAYIDCFK
ncbi:MAG: Fic family protein [Lascolabacillus sp.]|jgi:Fic family protein|uniref:Fic family protein n=1 Tax=Lascolabacillus sp. TaxID=1924068 RepID=UPI001219BDDA|nr:Fic family protein [Lascolabacillus sp.]MDD4758635.1 Fic family protein [Lascolabacillus sp.]TAH60661.1 MAG: Fic family protein [Fermentimonas caenicola]